MLRLPRFGSDNQHPLRLQVELGGKHGPAGRNRRKRQELTLKMIVRVSPERTGVSECLKQMLFPKVKNIVLFFTLNKSLSLVPF